VGVLCIRSILSVFPSDLPGVNSATLNEMVLYYRLMTKWSGLGDSMKLSRMGLSHTLINIYSSRIIKDRIFKVGSARFIIVHIK
jgi:hypothetical protein